VAVGLPLEAVEPKDLEWQLGINVIGQHRVTRALMPSLIEAKGRIVNISSIAGRVGMPFMGPYSTSKHALEGWSDVLRREMAPFGVKVSVIQPGSVKTPIWDKSSDSLAPRIDDIPDRYRDQYERLMTEAVRFGNEEGIEPEEVASAIAHALTADRPKARYALPLQERILARVMPALPEVLSDRLMAAEITRRYGGDD
jgi:NAD(P)-dependent dehydrogenase (short-subunit alcohol dehydrogenase family)